MNLQTGNYKLAATDVDVTSPGAGLAVSRVYESRNLSAGREGPLGPQWALSLPDSAAASGFQRLEAEPTGNVEATTSEGVRLSFVSTGGGFESPAGYQTETLSKPAEGEYRLTDAAGDATIFKHSSDEPAGAYRPGGAVQATGAGGLNKVTYLFTRTTSGITEPTAMIAPSPAGVACEREWTEHLKTADGCRILSFNYAESTTASGEAPEDWGDYKGHLTRVYLHAWEAGKTEPTTKTLAQYAYDQQGRLRAEWNPEVTPALKAIYGYNQEGYVTALTQPGQETWTFTYGSDLSDESLGRLLKALQAPVATPLWKGEAIANTEAPKLSGSAAVGNRMAVSEGKWSGSPVSYAFQWEQCTASGKECTPIPGASNANFSPTSTQLGHTLVAQVSATNAGGSDTVTTASSGVVSAGHGSDTKTVSAGESLTASSCIKGNALCALAGAKGSGFTSYDLNVETGGAWFPWGGPGTSPSWALNCEFVCLLADGNDAGVGGNLYYGTWGGSWTEAYSPSYGVDAIGCSSASFCVDGQGDGYFRWATNPQSSEWHLESQGSATMKSVACLSSSFCVIGDSNGTLHVATSTSQIESSSWTQTNVGGSQPLSGVACTSTSSCIAVDGTGSIINLTIESSGKAAATSQDIDAGNGLTAVTCTEDATCVAVDNQGDIFTSNDAGATWSHAYSVQGALTSVSCGTAAICVATGTEGQETSFVPIAAVEQVEAVAPQPGTTVEYEVPVSGTGAPHELDAAELAKWGQHDDPATGTAILPPEEPQTWPASSYTNTKATVYYLDRLGRLVNVANPAGGISTAEYNPDNNVERTLSADNRATALKAGSQSAEVAEHLSTQSTYNLEGTELESTLGPEHLVKISGGSKVEARQHVSYTYDQGAPSEGGPYYLLTETKEAARLATGEEKEERRTSDSYEGQDGLGWKLRAPTSTTTAPGGLALTHTTLYSPTTGAEIETRMPAPSTGEVTEYPLPGEGKPDNITKGAEGDLWFTDGNTNKVGRMTPAGAVTEYALPSNSAPQGITLGKEGDLWFTEENSNKIAKITPAGAISEYALPSGSLPTAIAVGAEGDLWFTGNSKIAKITPAG
ncbi:MAG: virginiamycin B lyase family protein, partial [Solirubrobacteraceae bacterium]